jgi:hypothetical protein
MGLAHSPRIVTDNLVLALDAANTKSYSGSGTTWTDLSSKGNNGTLTGGPTYSSSDSGYFDFDGSNDTVTFSSNNIDGLSSGSATQFSIMGWVKWDVLTSTPTAWFEKQNATGLNVRLELSADNTSGGRVWFVTSNTSTSISGGMISNYLIDTNKYYHMALVCDGTSKKGYINGVEEYSATESFSNTYPSNSYTLGIGGAQRKFNGRVANVTIYNEPLTAAEVKQNFNALRGRYGI